MAARIEIVDPSSRQGRALRPFEGRLRRRGREARGTADCGRCGGEARVRILDDYLAKKPVVRRLCVPCSDEVEQARGWRDHLLMGAPWIIAAGAIGLAAMMAI